MASRQENTVTLDAGARGKMKVLLLSDNRYRVFYEGASADGRVYDDLNEQRPTAEQLRATILDWAYDE